MSKSIFVGNIRDIQPLSSRIVCLDQMEIALFRLSTGEIKAVENACPHKKGKLSEGMVCGHHVFCPLHDWKIDLHSGSVQAPDEGEVPVFQVEVDQITGAIMLTVGNNDILAS